MRGSYKLSDEEDRETPHAHKTDCCEEAGSTMIGQTEADRVPTTACSA
jgi:hypothetical protein